jgi:hypothetical protein
MYLPLVQPDGLSPELHAAWSMATPDGKRFVGVMAHAPEHAERLFSFYNGTRYRSGLGMKISELCRLAAVIHNTRCAP